MLRAAAVGSSGVTLVVLAAACGGALAPEDGDAGARGTSSSTSSSGAVALDAGGARKDGGRPGSVGLVACPDRYDQCGTETGDVEVMACCVEGAGYSCRSAGASCQGSILTCDEGADCITGVCCAEASLDSPISSRRAITTQCRPTCITGVPRVQVCTSNADCGGTTCQDWSCAGLDMLGIKTCAPLAPCD